MSTKVDWLSAIKRIGPDAPPVLRRIVSKADEVFSQGDTASSREELLTLDSQLSAYLYECYRVVLGAHTGLLQRQLLMSLQTGQPIEQCFALFEALSRAGWRCPVEKSRVVIVLLDHLENILPFSELKPLVEAMLDELEKCRLGCEENLGILRSFLEKSEETETGSGVDSEP